MSGAANDAATWVPAELPADQGEAAFEPEWWLEESTLISPFTTDVSTGSAGTAEAALVEALSSPFRSPVEIEALAVDDDEAELDDEDQGFEDGPRDDEAYSKEGSEDFDQGEDEELGATLEGEHPLSRLFRLPAAAFEALAKGAFPAVIALAGAAGYRDVNDLTNIIFYFRNPHVIGRRIRADERDLQQSWLNIRDTIVRPALKSLAAPAPVPAPTGAKTSIPASGLQWHGPGEATPELCAFMRDVYDRHVARSSGTFVDTLPGSALKTIEGIHCAQRPAARKAVELLAAARADLRDPRVKIGITSAYRSADRQFDIWQGKGGGGQRGFPYYYRISKTRRQRFGDEHGAKAAAHLTDLIAECIAAPGYSNHQDGLAIDFGTGVVGKSGLAKIGTDSWFYKWLRKNAHRFDFERYPAEPWHWIYKPPAGSPQAFESEAWPAAASAAGIRAGRLHVDHTPTLASHRGKSPDIVLRWNDMPSVPSEIDVVVHLHGYSGPSMTLPKSIEPWSGLDLAPVDGAAGSSRRRPTLTILPRGDFTGEQRGELYKYTFPALITKDGLPKLINSSLARFARHHGSSKPAVGRLIITAHSGGGAALMRILRNHNPHEVHVFDGLYQDATALAEWASRHIRRDKSAGSPPGGALRVFYRPGTQRFSRQLLEAISVDLASAPRAVQDRYRVEASTLGHWQIPRQYGWRILADAAADDPAARREPDTTVQRLDELESSRLFDDDEAATGELTAEAWELEQPEIEEPERENLEEPHNEGLDATESEWELLGPTDEAQTELSAASGTPEDSHQAVFVEDTGEQEAERAREEEYEDKQIPGSQTADAFVADKDGKEYFDTFSQFGNLTVKKATILTSSNFESLMDNMLASNEKHFVIDAHGNPSGLSMHLASGTIISATKHSLFILRGIEYIQTLMRVAKESDTIWERTSGADLDRWRRIAETMHSKSWQKMVGPTWPTETPYISSVEDAKSIALSRIASLMDSLFPGVVKREERVNRLIKKMLQLQARGIREIQFRACNIGKDSVTLYEFRKFFGADHLCAPDVRSGMGFVDPRIDRRGAVDRLAKRKLTQIYSLPSGRFAISIDILNSTFKSSAAADTQEAVAEWVATHIMANSRYRKGKLPIHFLQAPLRLFALDNNYAAHIKCHSSFWEGAVRANELEEQEAHKDRGYEPDRFITGEQETDPQREDMFEFDSLDRLDEPESEDEPEEEERWDNALEQDAAGLTARQELEAEALRETLDPDREFAESWTGQSTEYETDEGLYDSVRFERQTGHRGVAPRAAAIDPFPTTPTLTFYVNEPHMMSAFAPVLVSPVNHLCAALVDLTGNLTGNLAAQPYAGLNDEEMVFAGSMVKICAMYAAFALRSQVQAFVCAAAANGAPVVPPGITSEIEKAWKPKLQALFPNRPAESFGNKQDITFPKLDKIFSFSADGRVDFARATPALTDKHLDGAGELGVPKGKFHDWMRLMLRWSNNTAASHCILALGYFYINGALAQAGFFDSATNSGLWLSADYAKHDWVRTPAEKKANAAGPLLTPRWATAQRTIDGSRQRSNITATATQTARFMTLLALGKLVDADAKHKDPSDEMRTLMQAAIKCVPDSTCGIGSYVKDALDAPPSRPFTTLAAKKGYGDDKFSHECAIVERTVGGKNLRYVVVGLGSAPNRRRRDLSDLFVRLDEAIVVRNR